MGQAKNSKCSGGEDLLMLAQFSAGKSIAQISLLTGRSAATVAARLAKLKRCTAREIVQADVMRRTAGLATWRKRKSLG